MLNTVYNAILQIVGSPAAAIANQPLAIQIITISMYLVSSLIVLMVVSFVFKFILKMVER